MRTLKKIAAVALVGGACGATVSAADLSKLPPASDKKIAFDQDIRPIFESSCLRCHGPEKPKSGFRLDNRDSALKGGKNGVAIVPGKGAESALVQYVARLVEDMEMPPTGKGDPLSREQVARLRAWIDQGADWTTAATNLPPKLEFTTTTTLRYVTVSGNEQKFRERMYSHEGWSGGVQDFHLKEQVDKDTRFEASGSVWSDQHDFSIKLALTRNELGFVRAGFEQFRKYFDDSGGYSPAYAIAPYVLGRDLHLDVGKVWFEVGLDKPTLPKLTLGYEYGYKEGNKSLTSWGQVQDGAGAFQSIYPTIRGIDEKVHVIRLDAAHDWQGYHLEDNFRVEFYDQANSTESAVQVIGKSSPDKFVETKEGYNHFQAANTFRVEKPVNDWLMLAGGYLFTQLNGEALFQQSNVLTPNASVIPTTGYAGDDRFWFSHKLLLSQYSHTFNLNSRLGPWEGLTFATGIQGEVMRQEGIGDVDLQEGDPMAVPLNTNPARMSASLDRSTVDENFSLRYTSIPFTVLYADGRFQQEQIGQIANEADTTGLYSFGRNTESTGDLKEFRVGFNVSPTARLGFTGHYKHRVKETTYDHLLDLGPFSTPGYGYSAFILGRKVTTDEVEGKITFRATRWMNLTLGYRHLDGDYDTTTDSVPGAAQGGSIHSGNTTTDNFSLGVTLTPWQRLYLNTTFSFEPSKTWTDHNSLPVVADYKGDVYNVVSSGTLVLSEKTDLTLSYSFSRSDYSQSSTQTAIPLGAVYDWHGVQTGLHHRFSKQVSGSIQYSYYLFNDVSNARVGDFSAHGIMTALTYRLP